jgi:5-(aminomethyl)-3-furanmethanol phosphate kinase
MAVDVVVKVGGSVLAHAVHFDSTLTTIAEAGRLRRVLVVPGGGPFARAVRRVDHSMRLSDDAAHWMAILAMDQYAHLIASRLMGGIRVSDRAQIDGAFGAGRIPVLAPYAWTYQADPLPHSWDVTSDSIAAWVAGEVGAPLLVLVKAPGARGASGKDVVDPYFARALPSRVKSAIVPADAVAALRSALSEQPV